MSNYFPAGCSFTFDNGWNYDSRGPVACEVKLFSDDPYGSPNAHGSPINNNVPPTWSCGHPNNSACTAGSSDGITTICQSNGFWKGVRTYTDPPVGPPYEQGSNSNAYRCCEQGRGLCAPTMLSRGITNPQGQFPMARKPVRSYHNGIFSSQNYNSLPRGWYIWLRFCPLFSTVSSYTYDRFLYKYTTILFPGSFGACSFDGRQNVTYSFYAVNEQPNPYWAPMPYYGCLAPSPFRFAGYLGDYFRIDMLVTNGFLQNSNFSNPRRIFESACAPCF